MIAISLVENQNREWRTVFIDQEEHPRSDCRGFATVCSSLGRTSQRSTTQQQHGNNIRGQGARLSSHAKQLALKLHLERKDLESPCSPFPHVPALPMARDH